MLNFVSPDLPVLHLPAWDCLPYDRVSPGADASARRLAALAALASLKKSPHPAVIITTANAILQKLPPQAAIAEQVISARPGNQLNMNDLGVRLERNGFERVSTVRDIGEYAVRGAFLIFMRRVQKNRCVLISLAIRWKQSVLLIRRHNAPQARARNSYSSQ